jgi:hypothetical protein
VKESKTRSFFCETSRLLVSMYISKADTYTPTLPCRARRRSLEVWSGWHVMSDLGHVSCENTPTSAFQPLPVGGLVLDITCLRLYTYHQAQGLFVHKRTYSCQNTGRPDYQRPNTPRPRPRGQSDDTDVLTWRDVHGPAPILKSVASLPCMYDSKNPSLRVKVYLTVQSSC